MLQVIIHSVLPPNALDGYLLAVGVQLPDPIHHSNPGCQSFLVRHAGQLCYLLGPAHMKHFTALCALTQFQCCVGYFAVLCPATLEEHTPKINHILWPSSVSLLSDIAIQL